MIPGKRINLWALEKHDLLNNYSWGNNRELIYLAGMSPYPKSSWEIERWFETAMNNPSGKIFAIKTLEGEYIGNIEISGIDWRIRKGELGLMIGDSNYWNKGYGEEAVMLLVNFAFDEMHLNRISANVLDFNKRAIKCFEKCGFIKEGISRSAFYSKGKYNNVIQFAVLSDERRGEKKEGKN